MAGSSPSAKTRPGDVPHLEQAVEAFEEAWQQTAPAGAAPILEHFLPAPPADDRELLLELIAVDLQYRWRQPPAADAQGPRPRLEAYLARYPQLGSVDQ